MFEDHDGRLWAGTDNGLGLLDPNPDPKGQAVAVVYPLSGFWVNWGLESSDGRLWFATQKGLWGSITGSKDDTPHGFRNYGVENGLNFGGAEPPANSILYPSFASPQDSSVEVFGDFDPYGLRFIAGQLGNNLQRQVNLTDSASHIIGAHQLKFGIDYRRLRPNSNLLPYQVKYGFFSLSNILAITVPEVFVNSKTAHVQLIFSNWSLFAQDAWKATRTLTITYGLRWEYNAAPSSPNDTLPFTVTGVDNLATMTLAPPGTLLWHPQKDDFAPRLGVAWQPIPNLVLRAGAGIFYDLGYSEVANGTSAFPFAQSKTILISSFPLGACPRNPQDRGNK